MAAGHPSGPDVGHQRGRCPGRTHPGRPRAARSRSCPSRSTGRSSGRPARTSPWSVTCSHTPSACPWSRSALDFMRPDGTGWDQEDEILRRIAATTPLWEPETKATYHANTYGWMLGRADPAGHGEPGRGRDQRRGRRPLGIDFSLGARDGDSVAARRALVITPPRATEQEPEKLAFERALASADTPLGQSVLGDGTTNLVFELDRFMNGGAGGALPLTSSPTASPLLVTWLGCTRPWLEAASSTASGCCRSRRFGAQQPGVRWERRVLGVAGAMGSGFAGIGKPGRTVRAGRLRVRDARPGGPVRLGRSGPKAVVHLRPELPQRRVRSGSDERSLRGDPLARVHYRSPPGLSGDRADHGTTTARRPKRESRDLAVNTNIDEPAARLDLRAVWKTFGGTRVLHRRLTGHRPRRGARAHGSERLGQVHPHQDPRGFP